MSLYAFKMPGKQPHTFADSPTKKGAFVVVSMTTKAGGLRVRPARVRSVWKTGHARSLWLDRAYGEAEVQVYTTPFPAAAFERVQHEQWDSLESARVALSALPR